MTHDPNTIDRNSRSPIDSTEASAVEAVVRDYIDGWHAGDAQRTHVDRLGSLRRSGVRPLFS
jgi:hypothetical protein